MKLNYNLTNYNENDPSYFSQFARSMRTTDCIRPGHYGLNFPYRTHNSIFVNDCLAVSDCPTVNCEDQTCSVKENTCLTYCQIAGIISVTIISY